MTLFSEPPAMRFLSGVFFLFAALSAAPATQAAGWEKVVGDNERMVEIDSSSIFDSDHGTKVSWGRMVLGVAEATKMGYRTIKALNRYDCLNRSFSTIKRVYLDGDDNVLREEALQDQAPLLVRRNSVDERVLRKICGLGAPDAPAAKNNRAGTARRLDKLVSAADRAAKSANAASKAATSGGNRLILPANPTDNTEIKPADRAPVVPPSVAAATVNAPPEKSAVADAPEKPVLPPAPAPARFEPTPAAAPMPRPSSRALVPATAPAVSSFPAATRASRAGTASTGTPPEPVVFSAPDPVRHTAAGRLPPRPVVGGEDWSYYGAGGPAFWGKLRPEWKLCAEGTSQSPIDFAGSAPIAVDLQPVRFDYRPSRFRLTYTGQQLRVTVHDSMGMEVRGQRYALEGFVLHRPGETRIGGKNADMEAQFFHRDGEGRIAVLSVQLTRGDTPNALLQALLNNLPLEKGGSYTPETTIDLAAFLPASPGHFLYMGSLTAPPCTEGVLWVVMKEAATLSDEQFGIFSRLHPSNARPPQPANARLVLESR
ncbi:MAG: carbonic anhydrase family protein [Azoarcus sp.]|nr:carbonic anhydrase family protein [Azoarcus sp.]